MADLTEHIHRWKPPKLTCRECRWFKEPARCEQWKERIPEAAIKLRCERFVESDILW